MNTINTDLIAIIKDMPSDSINLDVVTIGDTQFYVYTVDFIVDQIAAYAANIRTMKVDIAFRRVGKKFSLLSRKTSLSANEFNSKILSGRKLRTEFLKEKDEEQKSVTIISKKSDLFARSKKISKFRLQRTRYTDLVTINDSYEIVTSMIANQSSKLVASDLVKNNLSDSTSKSGVDLYSNLILNGKDPAKSIVGASLVEDATMTRRGLGNLIRANTSSSNSFTTTATQESKNNLLPASLQAQKNQSVTTDVRLPFIFRLPTTTSLPGGKFSIICTITKQNGDLVQKIDFNVDHARQLIKYNIPKKLPTSCVSFISRTHAQINVFNDDPRVTNVMICGRDVPTYQSVDDQAPFNNIVTVQANSRQKYSSKRLQIKSGTNKFLRLLPVLSTGLVLGNFESKTRSTRSEVVAGSVLAVSNKGNVLVKLYGSPATYKYVQFVKRSVDRKQRTWTAIQNPVKLIDGIATIEDLDVLNEKTYEYAAYLQDAYGNTKKARSSSIVRVTDYTSGTEIIVTPASTNINNGNTTTTFNISVKLVKNSDTTSILAASKQQGTELYFEKETTKLSGDLSSITKVNVKRYSLDTGIINDLGVVEPGEFTDTTQENVVYIFEGLLRGQADLFEEIGADKISNRDFNPRDALQRSQIVSSNLTKIPAITNSNFTQKFLSKKSLLRGTLSYGNTKSADIDASGFLQGRLGITTTYQVTKNKSIATIDNFDLIIANESCRLLTFDVNQTNSRKNIDFFIITMLKGGIRSVIGTCHYVSDNITQNFLDIKTRLKTGKISYAITPVLYDGTTLNEVITPQFEAM
jgi:hypothetical protein